MEYLSNIKAHITDSFKGIGEYFSIKFFLSSLVTSLTFIIGEENQKLMLMLIILVAFDFITSIMGKYKNGIEIESRKALKTPIKIVVYGMFASGAHLTEQILVGTTLIDNMAISFLAITEFISIIENIGELGYAVPTKLLNKIKKIRDK